MSVPLPTPSPLSGSQSNSNANGASSGLSSAKPIPRSRPTPISTHSPKNSPSSPGASGSSFRRPVAQPTSSISRSFVTDDNWRDRSPAPSGDLAGARQAGEGGKNTKAPERTVGGFEKREIKSAVGAAGVSGLSREKQHVEKKDRKEDKVDKDADGKAALSHVPCRFFKAGACTAGDSCPFSHAAPDSAKREVCQWFLKGNCKFGHKCALAHVRPGEPMSMDRKNKKAAQQEARERGDSIGAASGPPAPSSGAGTGTSLGGLGESPRPTGIPRGRKNSSTLIDDHASPVPIRSALSSSMQSPPVGGRIASSPLREPFGPPSGAQSNSPNSAGFAHIRPQAAFASSPSRPSPLSASFGASGATAGPMSLRASGSHPLGSPLRPPVTANAAFSSSFSHSSLDRAQNAPLSASFAGDSKMPRNIWAPSDMPADNLSPRRPIPRQISSRENAVFLDDEEEHGEEFLPSSLSDLLTPQERARRKSRRDSQGAEEFPRSPGGRYGSPLWAGGERLAQSAGPTMGPGGFLQSLWSAEGEDARKHQGEGEGVDGPASGSGSAQASGRTSLLTQQRSPEASAPISPNKQIPASQRAQIGEPYLIRTLGEPSSPSARALQEHAPGQSLPGGIAAALSRLHLHGPRSPSGLGQSTAAQADLVDDGAITPHSLNKKPAEDHDEGLFAMEE
ncbi:hypothetical protein IAU60_000770 [Kwoniella sp. DSM 27419]